MNVSYDKNGSWLMLPPNQKSRWAREEQVGFIIDRSLAHLKSCTSLAAAWKPNHSLMPAKLYLQATDTKAESSHAQHRTNEQPSTQLLGGSSSPSGSVQSYCT
jgi:hypothetical protein